MTDPRYTYEKINVVKVIIENLEGKVLLVQEPETNEWMPGHWGLPGGKPYAKESLYEAAKRKIKEELGCDIAPEGIFRIKELLLTERTVLAFILVARMKEGIQFIGQNKTFKWVTRQDIDSMDVSEFTEYYNKELLLDFFISDKKLVALSITRSFKFFDLENTPDFKRWWESGRKDIQKT